MIREETPVELSFVKGIDESQEISVLPMGFVSTARNLIPEPAGALRARQKWIEGPTAGGKSGKGTVVTSTHFTRSTGPTFDAGDVGHAIWVFNTGIARICIIDSVTNANQIVVTGDNLGATNSNLDWYMDSSTTVGVHDFSTFPTPRKVRGISYIPMPEAGDRIGNSVIIGLDNPGGTVNTAARELWYSSDSLGGHWSFFYRFNPNVNFTNYLPVLAKGTGALLFSHPRKGGDGIVKYSGNVPPGPVEINNSPPVRALAYFKNRFFGGGTWEQDENTWADDDGVPLCYRLYFSGFLSTGGWAGSGDPPSVNSNFIDVGKDDGEAIEDMVPWTSILLIAKENSMWMLSGDGPNTFTLNKIDGVRGCRGRSIVTTPKGVLILGQEEVFFWKGGLPEVISGPIQSTYVMNGDGWRTGAYAAGKVYVSGITSGMPLLVFDLRDGSWTIEDSGTEDERMVSVASKANRLYGGVKESTTDAPVHFRNHPYGPRGKDDLSVDLTYEFRTPDYWLSAVRQPVTLRHVWAQIRQRSGSPVANELELQVYLDGLPYGNPEIVDPRDATDQELVFMHSIDLGGKTSRSIGFGGITVCPSGGAVYDIERIVIDVDTDEPRIG